MDLGELSLDRLELGSRFEGLGHLRLDRREQILGDALVKRDRFLGHGLGFLLLGGDQVGLQLHQLGRIGDRHRLEDHGDTVFGEFGRLGAGQLFDLAQVAGRGLGGGDGGFEILAVGRNGLFEPFGGRGTGLVGFSLGGGSNLFLLRLGAVHRFQDGFPDGGEGVGGGRFLGINKMVVGMKTNKKEVMRVYLESNI